MLTAEKIIKMFNMKSLPKEGDTIMKPIARIT
jgi:hypothetical protein